MDCAYHVCCRCMSVTTGGVADNRTDEERMSDLSEKRTSKFFNRALPDPPSSENSTSGTCPEELQNLYELISQSTTENDAASAAETLNVGEMYEDIDDCLERTDAVTATGSFNDSSSSHRSTSSKSSSVRHGNQSQPDDEYLEPVIPPEEEIRHSSNWRPSPAPRSSLSAAAETLHVSYVNAEMMTTQLTSVADGFVAMSKTCQDTLEQIAEKITARYITASWPTSYHLEWSDFEV